MDSSYWRIERWRLFLVLFLALLGGLVSGHWAISMAIALAGYIGWLLFKLRELVAWLEQGASPLQVPDSNGIWERISFYIQALQKKSEKRKKAMSRLLKRSQGIVGALPYAAVLLNKSNEIEWANQAAQHSLNISNKRDRGQRLENLLRLPEVYTLLNENARREIELVYPPGSGYHLAIQIIPIKKGPRLLIARDVSEHVRLQQMRRNFIANASHELRTPLTVVSGYLEMMQQDESLPEHLHQPVDAALNQAHHMQQIIEDLLILSRLESANPNLDDMEVIDMPALLHKQCLDTAKHLSASSHTIDSDIDPALHTKGIPAEITSVCNNLVSNAIRHTPPGTHIRITWQKNPEGNACLSVIDNGEGIAAEHIPLLSERFYRIDKGRSRETGGTGLGLAIVQHIMQRHAGRLFIESTVGKGSRFSACFPVAIVDVNDSDPE